MAGRLTVLPGKISPCSDLRSRPRCSGWRRWWASRSTNFSTARCAHFSARESPAPERTKAPSGWSMRRARSLSRASILGRTPQHSSATSEQPSAFGNDRHGAVDRAADLRKRNPSTMRGTTAHSTGARMLRTSRHARHPFLLRRRQLGGVSFPAVQLKPAGSNAPEPPASLRSTSRPCNSRPPCSPGSSGSNFTRWPSGWRISRETVDHPEEAAEAIHRGRGRGVRIAVLDSGIEATHPALGGLAARR